MKDLLGDRMKEYENASVTFVDGSKPVYMRIDGRSFSKFTKSLVKGGLVEKPRDKRFEQVFIEATKETVKEFHMALGFHQSDEVSLFFNVLENEASQLPFNGKVQKLCSVVSSYFTSAFMANFQYIYDDYAPLLSFDARVCELPSKAESTNMLVWRYQDARRNMIQDIAHHQFGHKAIDRKSTQEKYEMIGEPVLSPGNFIKRKSFLYKTHYHDGAYDAIRHIVDVIPVDFDKMTFEERMSLIYGDLD